MKCYTLKEVEEKISNYKDSNKYAKVPSEISPEFVNVEKSFDVIKAKLREVCRIYNVPYSASYDSFIDYVEGAVLSSRNWFSGLNYTSIRDIVNVKIKYKETVTNEEEFYKEFNLKYIVKGNKADTTNCIVELLGTAQPGRMQIGLEGMCKWQFFKYLKVGEINIKDKSDAFRYNQDIVATCSKPLIKKYNNKDNSMLLCTHYHTYVEQYENKDNVIYSPQLEKFDLTFIIIR